MSFSDQLKEKTWDLHERVEKADLNKQLFNPSLDLETYGQILKQFDLIFHALEPALAPFEDCQKIGYRNREALIKEDLKNLGIQAGRSPYDLRIPVISSPAQALGCAYVLEGSNMGAAFIRKQILKTFGADTFKKGGLSFFSQTQSAKDWQSFKKRMDSFFEDKADTQKEAALITARETFLAFEDAFDQFEQASTR